MENTSVITRKEAQIARIRADIKRTEAKKAMSELELDRLERELNSEKVALHMTKERERMESIKNTLRGIVDEENELDVYRIFEALEELAKETDEMFTIFGYGDELHRRRLDLSDIHITSRR